MYKTLFYLGTAVATLSSPTVICNTGDIQSDNKLPTATFPTAPQDATTCQNTCTTACTDGTTSCLNKDDSLAGCSFDFNVVESSLSATSCAASATPTNGQWSLTSQNWAAMTKVTISFGNDTITAINIGIATGQCDLTSPTLKTCTAGVCDITDWIKSQSGAFTIAVQDQSTPASPSDLSGATATVTTTTGKMYGAAKTCTDIKTNQTDCEKAGCKYCYDTTATLEGYKGCGVSPSVCSADGTTTTSTTTTAGVDSLMSVSVAAVGALLFEFVF